MATEQGSGMDQKAHVATYAGFINMAKWGTIATAIIAAAVVFLIAN